MTTPAHSRSFLVLCRHAKSDGTEIVRAGEIDVTDTGVTDLRCPRCGARMVLQGSEAEIQWRRE